MVVYGSQLPMMTSLHHGATVRGIAPTTNEHIA